MAPKYFAIITLFLLVLGIPNGESKGPKKPSIRPVGPIIPVEYVTMDPDYEPESAGPESPEDMLELAQDIWEKEIIRDLCPWAECQYCSCNNGERPTCSPPPPVGYRGPVTCKLKIKNKSKDPVTGKCFTRGNNPSMDCNKQSDHTACFPMKTPDNAQQMCFGLLTDCDNNLVEFCNCSRACDIRSRPPVITRPTPVPATTRMKQTASMKTTPKVPKTTRHYQPTSKPITKQMNSNLGNNMVTISDITGSMVNGSRGIIGSGVLYGSDANGTKEGTTPRSKTTEIQDFEGGYKTMLSSMGILALSFGGLLLVVLVFIITVICTCTCCCRVCRKRTNDNHQKLKNIDAHAYYYVDVDRQETLTATLNNPGKNSKPVIANPVYDGHFQTVAPLTAETEQDRVYSEADASGFVVISSSGPNGNIENMYAECRPKSQRINSGEPVTYMELDEQNPQKNSSPQMLTPVPNHPEEMRTSAIYTDLHFGEETGSISSSSNSADSETSADPDETDSSSSRSEEESITSLTDSGVDDEQRGKDHVSSSDDFEEDNAKYFGAKTLPLPTRGKTTDSLNDGVDKNNGAETSLDKTTVKNSPLVTRNLEDEDDPMTCYQKLRSKSNDRSFSIDSACSENTYNSLISASGSLKIVEEDGKYSSLSREGTLEGSKRATESSDGDNTYSELIS